MNIIKQNEIEKIVDILKNNGVVAIATDTVFGVCATTKSNKAFQNLLKVKDRPKEKAFPIMCADIEDMRKVAIIDDEAERIINHFMPGPLTIVAKKNKDVAKYIGNNETVAIRMATSSTLKSIIELLGEPIFMTSANKSGEEEYSSIEEIVERLPLVDGVVDSSPSYERASTIYDCVNKKVLREGPITEKEIKNILKEEDDER